MGKGEKDKNRLGKEYVQWGKAIDGFNVISNQFFHYFFGSKFCK